MRGSQANNPVAEIGLQQQSNSPPAERFSLRDYHLQRAIKALADASAKAFAAAEFEPPNAKYPVMVGALEAVCEMALYHLTKAQETAE